MSYIREINRFVKFLFCPNPKSILIITMSADNAIQTRAIILKKNIVDVMTSLSELSVSLSEKPDDDFNVSLQNLKSQECVISVCGKASMGKSQFINALIGKNILPVSGHSTTSQACKVTYSENESCALVFTNGESEPIAADEVKRYCSALESVIGDPRIKGRTLKYIEIKTPGKYLMPGVTFYDTPGLGSLNFSHADVTFNCINESNAVLFFCSSKQPFDSEEVPFICSILKITDNVLFVQSRADQLEDAQEVIARRDKELLSKSKIFDLTLNEFLQKRYNRTMDFKFYPLSSSLLLDSADENVNQEKANNWYKRSRFEEIKRAIEMLVFRTVNYSPSLTAYNEAARYCSSVSNALENENVQLSKRTQAEKEQFKNDVEKQKEEFEKKYIGEDSEWQKSLGVELEKAFKNIRKLANSTFKESSSLSCEIYECFNDFPENLSRVKDFIENVDSFISQKIMQEWRNIVNYASEAAINICDKFKMEMDSKSFHNNLPGRVPVVPFIFTSPDLDVAIRRAKQIKSAKTCNSLLSIAQLVCKRFVPVEWRPYAIAALELLKKIVSEDSSAADVDWIKIKERFCKAVKSNLKDWYDSLVGEDGEIEKLISQFSDEARNIIKKDLASRQEKFEKELERLSDNVNLSEQETKEKIKTNDKLLKKLEGIRKELETCYKELDKLRSDMIQSEKSI